MLLVKPQRCASGMIWIAFSSFLFLIASGSIVWTPLPKYEVYDAYETRIPVPQDHFDSANNKTMDIFVRNLRHGLPKYFLWMIPGGPGQDGRIMRDMLKGWVVKDTWIYFMDHRGTGKSGKLFGRKDSAKLAEHERLEEHVKNLDFPPQIITTQNAAKDLIFITKLLMEDLKGSMGSDPKFLVRAHSYGTFLTYRAMHYEPDLFSGVLLLDFMPDFRMEAIDYGPHLHSFCTNDCLQKFPTYEAVTETMSRLKNYNSSSCSHYLKTLIPESDCNWPTDDMRILVRYLIKIIVIIGGDNGPRLAFDFLSLLDKCPSIHSFKGFWARNGLGLIKFKSLLEVDSNDFTNMSAMIYITLSEIQFGENMVEERAKEGENHLSSKYETWLPYLRKLGNIYKPFLYKPENFRYGPLKTKARVIVMQGRLDIRADHYRAKTAFDLIESEDKLMLSFDRKGHGAAWDSGCLVYGLAALLTPTEEITKALEECVSKSNQVN